MASDHRLFVTIISPQGVLLASENEAFGQMNFLTKETGRTIRKSIMLLSASCRLRGNFSTFPSGFYQMCFGNRYNQFGDIRVFLNFGVIYKDFEESKREIEEGEKVLNMTLANIEVFGLI